MGDLLGSPRVAPLILPEISTLRSTPAPPKFSTFLFSSPLSLHWGVRKRAFRERQKIGALPKRPGDDVVFEKSKNHPENIVGVIFRVFKSTPVDSIDPFCFRNMVIIVVTITGLRDTSVLRLERFLDIAGPVVYDCEADYIRVRSYQH